MQKQEIPNTTLNRQLALGHEIRKGHKYRGILVSQDGKLWHKVALCCGEEIPEKVETWEEAIPEKFHKQLKEKD